MEPTERQVRPDPHGAVAKVLAVLIVAAIGLFWFWFTTALWVGCETSCSEGWSYARWVAAVGAVAFTGACIASFGGNRRWSVGFSSVGLAAVVAWLLLMFVIDLGPG